MTPSDPVPAPAVPPTKPMRWGTLLLGFLLIVATFSGAGLYLSADVHLRKVEASAATDRATIEQRAALERAELVASANAAASAQTTELFKTMALSLSWAVRQALQEKDYREIAVYFEQLTALPDVRRAALVSTDGIVKVASDKKLEGSPIAKAFPAATIEAQTPAVHAAGPRLLEAVVPIMGLNARMGTLIVDYEPARVDQPPLR